MKKQRSSNKNKTKVFLLTNNISYFNKIGVNGDRAGYSEKRRLCTRYQILATSRLLEYLENTRFKNQIDKQLTTATFIVLSANANGKIYIAPEIKITSRAKSSGTYSREYTNHISSCIQIIAKHVRNNKGKDVKPTLKGDIFLEDLMDDLDKSISFCKEQEELHRQSCMTSMTRSSIITERIEDVFLEYKNAHPEYEDYSLKFGGVDTPQNVKIAFCIHKEMTTEELSLADQMWNYEDFTYHFSQNTGSEAVFFKSGLFAPIRIVYGSIDTYCTHFGVDCRYAFKNLRFSVSVLKPLCSSDLCFLDGRIALKTKDESYDLMEELGNPSLDPESELFKRVLTVCFDRHFSIIRDYKTLIPGLEV